MAKTLKELAQQALDIQDACNSSGLVISWATAICELRQALTNSEGVASTHAINTHPITVLWIDKLADLAGIPIGPGKSSLTAYQAHKTVMDIANS